jgi:hypothetical protein
MPEYFHCRACRLAFETGWFHYFEYDDGFASETRLVCSNCGTMHRVQHAIHGHQPDRLSAQSKPLEFTVFQLVADGLSPEQLEMLEFFGSVDVLFGGFLDRHYGAWQGHTPVYSVRPWRSEVPAVWMEAIKDELHLESVKCANCTKTGRLTEWRLDDQRCPRCKSLSVRFVGTYTT